MSSLAEAAESMEQPVERPASDVEQPIKFFKPSGWDSTLDPGYRRIAVWKTGMAPAVLVGYVDAAEEAYFARHGRPSHNVKPISSAPHIAAEKGLLEWTLEIDMASIPKNNYRVLTGNPAAWDAVMAGEKEPNEVDVFRNEAGQRVWLYEEPTKRGEKGWLTMGFGLTTEVDGFGRTTSNRPCVAPAAHALFFAGGFASMQNTSQKGCTPWRYQLTGKLRKATEKDQEYAAKVVDSKAAVLRDLLRNKEALCDALLRRS